MIICYNEIVCNYDIYLAISFLHLCVCTSTVQRPSTHWRGRPVDVAGLCVALRSISARTQQLDVKTTTKSKVSEGLKFEACEVEVDVVFDVVVIIVIIIIQVDVGFTVVMRLVCLQASLSLFPQSISVFCWDKSVFMGLRFGLYRITRTSGTGQCLLHSAYLSAICGESSAVRRRVPWQPNKFYRPYTNHYAKCRSS